MRHELYPVADADCTRLNTTHAPLAVANSLTQAHALADKLAGEHIYGVGWLTPHTGRIDTSYRGDPGAEGIAAARADARAMERERHNNKPSMWLVTKPTVNSELVDVLWPCDWVSLANAFRGGVDGSEVVGLYHHETQARNVAQSLLDVRDGKLDPAMVRA